jgi:Sec-independent protein translocase protein TatA
MGAQELLIVAAVLLVLLIVPARLPHMARSVAEGLREFRRIGKQESDDATGR